MKEPSKILLVDDEPQITRVLRRGLIAQGYEVLTANDGDEALALFSQWKPHLVVTDLSMPNLDGLQLCRKIREASSIPIIVLSVKGEERTKVEALDAGADDYITKPFGLDELSARVRAALRRAPTENMHVSDIIKTGDFQADLSGRTVSVKGHELHLTPKEYELLIYLLQHPNKVLTHHALLNAVWGNEYSEQTEYLRVFIGQLRKKIEPDPAKPKYILTEPWVGYRFNPDT